MTAASFLSAAAAVLQLVLRASALSAPSPPSGASVGPKLFCSPRRLNSGGRNNNVVDVDADAPSMPRRRHIVSSAMGTLAASTLLPGRRSPEFPSCGCCRCRLYDTALLPPAANALVETTPPSPDLAKIYDRPRHSGVDNFFSYAMSTGMDDYEVEARPYKTELFRTLFDSLASNRKGSEDPPSVLEIGMGTFPNAFYYAQSMQDGNMKGLDIISVDPNDSMFQYAKISATRSGLLSSSPDTSLRSVHGVVEALPFADGSIDAVVGTLTLCSVSSQERALSEIRRVLKPNGSFLFWEHVLAEDDPGVALQQKLLSPLQTLVADGCHLDRRTGEVIKNAGFQGGVEMEYVRLNGPSFLSPTVYGIASS